MEITIKESAVKYTVMKHGVLCEIEVRCNETGYVWDNDMKDAGVDPAYRTKGDMFKGHPCILGRSLPYVKAQTIIEIREPHIVETEKTTNRRGEEVLTVRTVVGTWEFVGVVDDRSIGGSMSARSVSAWSR